MQTILIVDDDPQIIKFLEMVLEAEGYATLAASDGSTAIKTFRDHRPELTILDIIMPEKEGLETIIEFKRIDPGVKIIAISGGGTLDPQTYLPMAKQVGAVDTMAKPIDKNALLHKVQSILSDG